MDTVFAKRLRIPAFILAQVYQPTVSPEHGMIRSALWRITKWFQDKAMMAKTLHGSNDRHGWCASLQADRASGLALIGVLQ
jgi:hypothetical protein